MIAAFRFYGDLNDFLPKEKRGAPFRYLFSPHQTVKDLIEALGVPHGEVELILINGKPADFATRPTDEDRISVYPHFASIDIAPLPRLRPPPPREPRFILDVSLGRLSAHLRLLGLDTVWRNDFADEELVEAANRENRILLTRDRRLLMRKAVTYGYFVRDIRPSHQLIEVIRRFELVPSIRLFERCLRCNGPLRDVEKDTVEKQLEPKTRLYYDQFSRCESCGRVYWKGSHFEKLERFVAKILEQV